MNRPWKNVDLSILGEDKPEELRFEDGRVSDSLIGKYW